MRLSTEARDRGRAEYERWIANGWRPRVMIDGINADQYYGPVLTADTDMGMIRYVPWENPASSGRVKIELDKWVIETRFGVVAIFKGV